MKPCHIILLFLLFFGALGIRLSYQHHLKIINPVRADATKYVIIANNLLDSGVYSEKKGATKSSYFITPGYPLFLTTIMLLSENEETAFRLILYSQAFIGAAVAVLTVLIAFYFLPFSLAYAAGILSVLSPHLISISSLLLTETLFCFLMLLALFVLLRGISSSNIRWGILAGLFFGCAALVRPAIVAFPLFLSPLMILRFNRRFPAAFLLASFLFYGLWLGWTKVNSDTAINYPSALGASLALGIYPDLIHKNPLLQGAPYGDDAESKHFPHGICQTFNVLAERFQKEPLRYVKWYLFGKPAMFWSKNILAGAGGIHVYPVISTIYDVNSVARFTKEFMQATHPVILWSVMLGAFLVFYSAKRRTINQDKLNGIITIYALLIYVTLVHTVLAPLPRYSIPFRPILYIAFGVTIYLTPIFAKDIAKKLSGLRAR